MPKHLLAALAAAAVATIAAPPARANTLAFMLEECAGLARQFHGDFEARTDMRDQGERTDGVYVIGGDIFLETRKAYVSCSFAEDRTTLVEFFVDGEDQAAFFRGGAPSASNDEETAAIRACRDRIASVSGVGRDAIELLDSEFGEAGTLASFRDANGETWECLGYADGAIGDLRVVEAAGGGGGSDAPFVSGAQQVRFPAGTTGTELRQALMPGESVVYNLGARDGQELYFRLAADGPGLSYQIFNPDGSQLLDMTGPEQAYRGQLWQSGDHGIEVVNRSSEPQSFNVIFGIE